MEQAESLPMSHHFVEYVHDDRLYQDSCYIPDAYQGELPIVLIIPDYHGATQYAENEAQALAELGYIGYCVDFYGERAMPRSSQEAGNLIVPFIDDRIKALNRNLTALKKAKELDCASRQKVAAIGFSSGGMFALDMARRVSSMKGVICIWGLLIPWQLRPFPMIEANVEGPKVLILQGTDDIFNPLENIFGIIHEFDASGIDYQLILLGGQKHAFSLRPEQNLEVSSGEDPKALLYNSLADLRSHQYTNNFLSELFL